MNGPPSWRTHYANLGIRAGDRVAYLGPNHPTFLETLFATGLLGAVFVPLNSRLAPPELAYSLRQRRRGTGRTSRARGCGRAAGYRRGGYVDGASTKRCSPALPSSRSTRRSTATRPA